MGFSIDNLVCMCDVCMNDVSNTFLLMVMLASCVWFYLKLNGSLIVPSLSAQWYNFDSV